MPARLLYAALRPQLHHVADRRPGSSQALPTDEHQDGQARQRLNSLRLRRFSCATGSKGTDAARNRPNVPAAVIPGRTDRRQARQHHPARKINVANRSKHPAAKRCRKSRREGIKEWFGHGSHAIDFRPVDCIAKRRRLHVDGQPAKGGNQRQRHAFTKDADQSACRSAWTPSARSSKARSRLA